MEICVATERDLDAVDQLLVQTRWHQDQSAFGSLGQSTELLVRRRLRRALPRTAAGILLALDNHEIVGLVGVNVAPTAVLPLGAMWVLARTAGVHAAGRFAIESLRQYRPRRTEAYVLGLSVAASHRRRGIATQLVAAAEGYASGLGKLLAVSFIARDNVGSLAVWASCGWSLEPNSGARYIRATKCLGDRRATQAS